MRKPLKIRLGFKLEDTYINSGFLLINLKKWRKNDVEEKFIQFMIENQDKFYFHDQGVLNNVFKNQFLILNPKYNILGFFLKFEDYDLAKKYSVIKGEYYSKEIVNQARQNPIFLHFAGDGGPWRFKIHPYRDLYVEYGEMAGFNDELIEDNDAPFDLNLFYKSYDNFFIKLVLKMIPSYFIYKIMNKLIADFFDREEEKLKRVP